MEQIRTPFQGVTNILRFNWHFYVLSLGLLFLFMLLAQGLNGSFRFFFFLASLAVVATMAVSLAVSHYVYDLSSLYKFPWLADLKGGEGLKIVNVHAGFDETSRLLVGKLKPSEFVVLDFYDPKKHTEVSIKRARRVYPAFPGTLSVDTENLPLPNGTMDKVFAIFAAHEIRNREERILFFKELNRILDDQGEIVVTEHLRDVANFLAYNLGFLHFYSKNSWSTVFASAGLEVKNEIKITPFVTTFVLKKNGITS